MAEGWTRGEGEAIEDAEGHMYFVRVWRNQGREVRVDVNLELHARPETFLGILEEHSHA